MQELAIHGWDIRSRLETAAPLSVESLSVLMTRIPARFEVPGYATFRLDARAPIPIRYRFALTGAVPSTHDIIVENEQARMEPAGTATPHVKVLDISFYQADKLEDLITADHRRQRLSTGSSSSLPASDQVYSTPISPASRSGSARRAAEAPS
jgi:hypothetical protein